MPRTSPPKMRKQARGTYKVRMFGKDYGLGRNHKEALKKYETLKQWWHEEQAKRIREKRLRQDRTKARRKPLSMAEAFEIYLDDLLERKGPASHEREADHVNRCSSHFEGLLASDVGPAEINSMAKALLAQSYAPKTINHAISITKRSLKHCMASELIPERSLQHARALPLEPVKDESRTIADVRRAIVREASKGLQPWMAINYLTACRPSEVIRIIRQEGEWIHPRVLRLSVSKTDLQATVHRHILFSLEALWWLNEADPDQYAHATSYMRTARDYMGGKVLRKSAATHLMAQYKVSFGDTQIILGHYPPRTQVTYVLPFWVGLLSFVSRLSVLRIDEGTEYETDLLSETEELYKIENQHLERVKAAGKWKPSGGSLGED